MPRPHHHRRGDDHIPPIPPVPPIPPIPPMNCGDSARLRFGELGKLFGSRGPGFSWGPFTFDFGDDSPGGGFRHRGGGGRGGRRGRRMFESGELRLLLLKLIADEPRHGYDCIRAIEDMTGGEYAPSPGVIYPTLTMLQDMGMIEESPTKVARKPFRITDEGQAHLDERADEVEALIERLEEMKPHENSSAGPAIGRAVKNLMTALSHRIGRDGLDEELLLEIAAILDDAAQRIERVK
ncbi:MAG: PadR family transcriptional regulator [Sphingomicrobium sp.]